jgi:hypothetical protein
MLTTQMDQFETVLRDIATMNRKFIDEQKAIYQRYLEEQRAIIV